jgi:hypothetical protein
MHKTAQAWFSAGPSNSKDNDLLQPAPSLLADWNAYTSSKAQDESDASSSFDLEAAVRTANDKVSGTFSV